MAPSAPRGSAFGVGVLISGQKMAKKFFRKNPGKISKFFFSIFPKFFSIEIIPRERRLRTQNFMTVGQTVSAVGELTDRQTDRFANLLYRCTKIVGNFSDVWFSLQRMNQTFLHFYVFISNINSGLILIILNLCVLTSFKCHLLQIFRIHLYQIGY